MVADALKGYIQLANGLTDVTKDRASAAAKSLAAQSPDLLGTAAAAATSTAMTAAVQVQAFTEELLVTSRDNRALLMGIIRTEVERVVTALGFAKESEVEAVRHKVDRLEEAVDGLGEDTSFATPSLRAALTPTKKTAATKTPAKKKAPAKKVAPTKAATKAAKPATKAAPKPATKPATAKVPVKKKAPARKVAAPKAVTQDSPAPAAPEAALATTEITPPSLASVSTPATPLIPPTAAATTAPDVVDLTRTEASAVDGTQG